jgi:hypothetical protein
LRPISRIILSLPCGEEKSDNRCLKYLKIGFAILAGLSAPLTNAEDFGTIQGKEYKDATVTRVEPDGIVVRTKGGVSKLYFSELPKEVQERLTLLNASKAHAGVAAMAGKFSISLPRQLFTGMVARASRNGDPLLQNAPE